MGSGAAQSKSARMAAYLAANPLLLAPMAGVCDVTFRSLCRELGAGLTYTEMVSAMALHYGNERTQTMLERGWNEDMVAVQLFGSDPTVIAEEGATVERLLGEHLALIDVNMGCPVNKVIRKGEGSALMKDPTRAAEIVRQLDAAVSVPVTVKFRRGFDEGENSCVDFALRMQDAGAAACTVHGRTAAQLYSGSSDFDTVASVAAALDIPVIGNGDLFTAQDVAHMFQESQVSGAMLARGARANPFLFREAAALLAGEDAQAVAPTLLERVELARRHAAGLAESEARGGARLVRMRKHASWYFVGIPHAAEIRKRTSQCSTLDDFNALFDFIEAIATSEEL